MTETQFTSKLVRAIRERLGPGAIVFKHADGYTAGIPDISISLGRNTLWLEAKLVGNPKFFEPLQLAILEKLDGHYIFWNTKTRLGCRFLACQYNKEEVLSRCCLSFNELVQNIINEVI